MESKSNSFIKIRSRHQAPAPADHKSLPSHPMVSLGRGRPVKGPTRKPKARRRGRRAVSDLPPTLSTTVTTRHTYRYYANGTATNANVTVGNLLAACGGVGTIANSQITAFSSSVRVLRISVWSCAATTGATNAEVVWETAGSSFSKDADRDATLPSGITVDRAIVMTPPTGSLASFWQTSQVPGNVVLQLTCGTGTVVDVLLESTVANNFSPLAVNGYAVVVLGTVYFGRLDGIGGKFSPLGLPTTN